MKTPLRLLSIWSLVVTLIPLVMAALPSSYGRHEAMALAVAGGLLVLGVVVYCRPRSASPRAWLREFSLRVRGDLPEPDVDLTSAPQAHSKSTQAQPPKELS